MCHLALLLFLYAFLIVFSRMFQLKFLCMCFQSEKSAQKARKLSGQSLEGNAIEVFSPLEIESQSLNQCSKEYPVFVAGLPHGMV